MSLAALATLLIHLMIFGAARQPDEGAAAHIWQLLMAGQAPFILWFAIRWIPRGPRQALPMLGIQAAAALAAMFPVWWLGL
jgi:hypothetical protein